MATVAVSLVFATAGTTLIARTLGHINDPLKDTSFVPRVLLLNFFLIFLTMAHSIGGAPYLAQGQYRYPDVATQIFNVIVVLVFSAALIQTKEPALAMVPVATTIYTMGVTFGSAKPDARGAAFWPGIVAFLLFLGTFLFFEPATYVDTLLDALFYPFGFDASYLPVGYLSGRNSSMRSGLVVACVFAIVGGFTVNAAQNYAANNNAYEPDVDALLDPKKNGLENLSRFLAAAQDQFAKEGALNPLPADVNGPMAFFLQDKRFRENFGDLKSARAHVAQDFDLQRHAPYIRSVK